MGKSLELMKKLRNTSRFLLGALMDFGIENRVADSKLRALDRFVLHQLNRLMNQIDIFYEE